jgi:hypothetical protein
MNVEEFKTRIQILFIFGFGFNKGLLNLNNNYIKAVNFAND